MENIRRRIFNASLAVGALAIGVATVVGLLSVSSAMRGDLEKSLDEYGANMVVAPESKSLRSRMGRIDRRFHIRLRSARDEWTRKRSERSNGAANINIVAPKLMGLVRVDGARRIIVGVRLKMSSRSKSGGRSTMALRRRREASFS